MIARPIRVELAEIDTSDELTFLELMQEREEQRHVRILTTPRRRPFQEERTRRG